ncbi:MAG: NAD-dependent epimerase/dehydratase family protein [Clostridiales bacterium]|nr:NAD-dependent epimerase/dehydratase family protein [Clostridiales bacterium]
MSEKVLLTGATGFLGGYVIKELSEREGYEVIAVGRNEKRGRELEAYKGVRFVKADITDEAMLGSIFEEERPDYVIHTGALSSAWGKYDDFYQANVKSTVIIGGLCIKHNIKRMVYISSPSIYTAKRDRLDIKEDDFDPANKLNFYIKTKLLSEKELHALEEKGLNLTILRPRGLIGPGDPSLMPRLMRANGKIGIPLIRKGKIIVDITCVQNVAYACYLAMTTADAKGMTFNITNGEPSEFSKLLELFCTEAGETAKFLNLPFGLMYVMASIMEGIYTILPTKKEPLLTRYTVCTLSFSQSLDISKAKEILGYSPKISLAEGIREYGKWWQTNK